MAVKAEFVATALINPSPRFTSKQPELIKPFVKILQNTLRTTDIGQKFFKNVARAETVKNILKEAAILHAANNGWWRRILAGASARALDFISYSGGPLEELLPAMPSEVPVRIMWGRRSVGAREDGRAYGSLTAWTGSSSCRSGTACRTGA